MLQQVEIETRAVTIAAEGAELTGVYYAPVQPAVANLVMHGATGVPQRYYAAFANWAASQGVGVLTYDYRDFGASQKRPMRESKATFADWAIRDQEAAERAMLDLVPEGPVWLLGHSLGGLTFAFRKHSLRVERITTIGAGFAYVGDHPWSYRPLAMAFWYGPGPISTKLAGYLPGKRLLLGEDLPAGVYWQWRKWCTSREFFQSDIGVSLPVPDFTMPGPEFRMLTMDDDVVVPPSAVLRYRAVFAPGRAQYRVLTRAEFGVPALKHIEVLSRRSSPAWPAILGLAGA